jgi:glutamate-ammonia-ligase adenylyltransferase
MTSVDLRVKEIAKPLPDPEAAERFYSELSSRDPEAARRLLLKEGLLADLLTLSAFSPLMAMTVLQNPEYIWWLEERRTDTRPRSKDELVEALHAFLLDDNSPFEVILSRFKRREFMRVFLLDIKRLVTISETTDEISHIADSILEFALAESQRRLERRFGKALTDDGKDGLKTARFTIVSFGKLGSRELNYSSDIDLLFIYSSEGETSGGESGKITNKEFFIKLSETVVKLVGTSAGEGSAYRVDMRLRPHGRVGPLAISLNDAVRYYSGEARPWERQILIRSRASAGDEILFKEFISTLSDSIYPIDQIPGEALRNVRLSKERIDKEQVNARGFNVKLGIGGIREIEFIAQALQLAHGSTDKWIRSSHTVIALSRLCDRGFINDRELVLLKSAYEFLRQLEHVLQMEHGLQTHSLPDDPSKQNLVARRMGMNDRSTLLSEMVLHTSNVSEVFRRIFGEEAEQELNSPIAESDHTDNGRGLAEEYMAGSFEGLSQTLKREIRSAISGRFGSRDVAGTIDALARKAPHFGERLVAMPWIFPAESWLQTPGEPHDAGIRHAMREAVDSVPDFASRMGAMRKAWATTHMGIVCAEVSDAITHYESKRLQTVLAEASIESALWIAAEEVLKTPLQDAQDSGMAILGLGKLGGRGIDFGSDLDLVLIHEEGGRPPESDGSRTQVFARISELFVNALSSMTRDGQMYRVDLRLRPDGKNGPMSCSSKSIIDYFRNRAAIWEWLAYLKVRCSGGSIAMGTETERTLRGVILEMAANESREDLAVETFRIRERLFEERCRNLDVGTIDIKYGRGGLLDIYFASRYLQLAHCIDEVDDDRSTARMLGHMSTLLPQMAAELATILSAYETLSRLDHALRLSQGRSTRLSLSNGHFSRLIKENFPTFPIGEIREQLPELMASVRSAFERILSDR